MQAYAYVINHTCLMAIIQDKVGNPVPECLQKKMESMCYNMSNLWCRKWLMTMTVTANDLEVIVYV